MCIPRVQHPSQTWCSSQTSLLEAETEPRAEEGATVGSTIPGLDSLSALRPGSAGAWPSQCRESCSRARMTEPPRQNAGVGNIPNRATASLGRCTRPSRHCGRPLPPPASTPALRMEKSRPSLHDPTLPRQSLEPQGSGTSNSPPMCQLGRPLPSGRDTSPLRKSLGPLPWPDVGQSHPAFIHWGDVEDGSVKVPPEAPGAACRAPRLPCPHCLFSPRPQH